MKRFFLSVMLLLAVSLSAFSQVKVGSGNTSVDVSVKRALAVGDDVVIDFVITCHNKWTKIQLLGQDDGVWAPIVFDDEGNVYKGTGMTGRLAYEVDGKRAYYERGLDVAQDVPRKFRLVVKGVDEYASSFALVKIPYFGDNNSSTYTIIVKDFPITRQ